MLISAQGEHLVSAQPGTGLLPNWEGGTVADWLAAHPSVEAVCRDRGSGFREGATKGAPQVLQICDRWRAT